MTKMNWHEVNMIAKAWVKEAGMRIKESLSSELSIEFKENPSDLVTNMDKQTEKFFITKIKEQFPEHKIMGEEGFGDDIKELTGTVWVIDPIDGTMNFVHMKRHYSISIGIYENGVGMIGIIYDVAQDEIYDAVKGEGAYLNGNKLPKLEPVSIEEAVLGMNASWALKESYKKVIPPLIKSLRGTRSFGSAAIEMANIAANRMDGYLTLRLAPWDFAGGLVIIQEVGGKITTAEGKALNMLTVNTVFVAKPGLHDDILERYLLKKDQ